jgi:1-acyl-sn-glycerol-3-phosphate acyltransferase
VLAAVMNTRVRHAHIISYKYLFEDPFVGSCLRLNQGVVLDNSTAEGRERAMADCRELLSRGKVVGMFPEARTAPFESMLKAQPGIGALALETGAPVVPVGLVGTQKVIPRKGDLPGLRWKAVSVHFGRPLDFGPYREPYRRARSRRQRLDIALGVTTIIMRAVAALSGQEYPHGAKSLARLERIAAEGAG